MTGEYLSGDLFVRMVRGGAAYLGDKREVVNDLNVFPIPDGDTGDNMFMTIDSGASKPTQGKRLDDASEGVAQGMLLGARGNSGVILSRIFAGIAKGLQGLEHADVEELHAAMKRGVSESYGAVSAPVEGTILTVFREGVEKAGRSITPDSSIDSYMEAFTAELYESLLRTPELLAVLKEAGVVDSGGAGLVYIAEGMKSALRGEAHSASSFAGAQPKKAVDLSRFNEDSELVYGYCTEFLLQLQRSKVDLSSFDPKELTDWLNANGESVVAFLEGTILKVHVHTKQPGHILNHCQEYGEFLTLKIENMTLQHSETKIENRFELPLRKKRKKYGVVAVAMGEGICETFRSLGVDSVVDGGQSMNPSAADFIRAFDETNADTIFVFPNNGNVILTARQAAQLYEKSQILVVESKDVGQGYAAVSMLDFSSDDAQAILEELGSVAAGTVTGSVSKAVRTTEMNGVEVRQGDYIGFVGDTVYADDPCAEEAALSLAAKLDAGKKDVLLVLSGKDAEEEGAARLYAELQKNYPRTEIIMIDGGQPIYDYILVLE